MLEQRLVKKNYIEYDNNKLLSYKKRHNPLYQISIERIDNRYKFTFPLESGDHYTSYHNNKNELETYAEYIISTYIK